MDRRHNRVNSATERPRRHLGVFVCSAISLFVLGACAPFDVNVGTQDPLKVDLNMEVHVYQHGEADEATKEAKLSYKEAMTRRRNRMQEIQDLKNNRLVGESHDGTLSIRSQPAGDYGQYVKKTVEAENTDREFLMSHEAEEKSTPLDDVRRMQWRHWQRKSFPGEWIELESDQPSTFQWAQKEGASEGGDDTESAPDAAAGN